MSTLDEEDPSPAGLEQVGFVDRARHRGRFEAWSGISDDDQHLARLVARDDALDALGGIGSGFVDPATRIA